MGVGIALAVGALVVGILAAVMFRPSMEGQDMSPASLESFQVTTTDEGSAVPWITGYVRTKSNLLWFGNLTTIAQTQEAGGKGGGGTDITTGYQYLLDLWHGLCLGGGIYGTVTFEGVYVGDREKEQADIDGWNYTFNDGTQSTYPTQPGENANAIDGVAHLFLNQYDLGVNVTFVPTFHWVIRCQSSAPLDHANMSNGTNPAARIYDVLRAAGSTTADFNMTSFQDAADIWYAKGYAINLNYSQQKEAREWVNQIFTYVDGCLRKDENDQWYLQAYDETDASVATFNKEDMLDFSITRRSWSETYNDFVANYTDRTMAYTRRTIRVQNGANQRLLGYKRQRTIDLTAFIDVDTASKRLAEIMKRESYPEAQITFSSSLYYDNDCHVGKVITINHDDYDIANADYRIIQRDVNEADSNMLDFRAIQVTETLFDDEYTVGGNPGWVEPTWREITAPIAQGWFELPLNPVTGDKPAILALVARGGVEEGYLRYTSSSGTDYFGGESSTVFGQHGTLDEEYADDDVTDSIDDSVGILYTPTREDPVFTSISRSDLFHTRRVAIIGNEMMAFQSVAYEGVGSSIRLTGVVRGLFNTPVSSHAAGSTIWLINLGETQVGKRPWFHSVGPGTFYLKCLPFFGQNTPEMSDLSAMTITKTYKSYVPAAPSRIVAVRASNVITVTVYFNSTHCENYDAKTGAGEKYHDLQTDQGFSSGMDVGGYIDRLQSDDYLQWKIGASGSYNTSYDNEFVYNGSTGIAFTMYVRRWNTGDEATIAIGAEDGTYIGPEI